MEPERTIARLLAEIRVRTNREHLKEEMRAGQEHMKEEMRAAQELLKE
jgi:hypothetical protein